MATTATVLTQWILIGVASWYVVSAQSPSQHQKIKMEMSQRCNISFTPVELRTLHRNDRVAVFLRGRLADTAPRLLKVIRAENSVARVDGNETLDISSHPCARRYHHRNKKHWCFNASFSVVGLMPGKTEISFELRPQPHASGLSARKLIHSGLYPVSVIKGQTALETGLSWTLFALLACNIFFLAFILDLHEIVTHLKKPIALAVGLCCQFVANPLLAYGLGRTFSLRLDHKLGLFGLGVAPPGAVGCVWTFLLGGDVILALLMNIIGTVLSFGFLPGWMLTLGRTVSPLPTQMPFQQITWSVLSLIIPVTLALVLRHIYPITTYYARKMLNPLACVMISADIFLNILSQWDLLQIIQDWKLILCLVLLPYLGGLISGVVTFGCQQSWQKVKVVAIFVTLQSTPVAIAMFYGSLPDLPEADIASFIVTIVSIFAAVPLWVYLAIRLIRQGCVKDGEMDFKSGRKSIKQVLPDNGPAPLCSMVAAANPDKPEKFPNTDISQTIQSKEEIQKEDEKNVALQVDIAEQLERALRFDKEDWIYNAYYG